jgi:hypothetical protein
MQKKHKINRIKFQTYHDFYFDKKKQVGAWEYFLLSEGAQR